eukprot:TRINITY_DN1121_c1_g2_i1.p1 TRINITY_DN1121_c1_g2~~TRINITY_DN1121_c1_g2_i1.p1  ORF type:complete len:117 (+),score=22.62 TRINITY_DN1121_c1_g2_i1:39-389(+)
MLACKCSLSPSLRESTGNLLDYIPIDIWETILQFCSARTCLRWGATCKSLYPVSISNLHTLYLDCDDTIEDNSLSLLTNIHTLHLVGNKHITDNSLSLLTNIHTLNLENNKIIAEK